MSREGGDGGEGALIGAEGGHCPAARREAHVAGRAAEVQVETWSEEGAREHAAPVGTLSDAPGAVR